MAYFENSCLLVPMAGLSWNKSRLIFFSFDNMFDFLVFSLYVDHFGLYSGHSEHEVVEILYSTYFL